MIELRMESWPYTIEFDRTGFPLIKNKKWQFYISLFPVSKYQFEQFMVDNGPTQDGLYTDNWYRNILSLNPRQKWQECKTTPWQLFITGLPEDAIRPFLNYLGDGFRLPRDSEWRMLHSVSSDLKSYKESIKKICQGNSALPVLHWIEKNLFPLTEEGIVEFITDNERLAFIGRPFNEFHPNLWNPNTVRQLNWDNARGLTGFRVVYDERR